MPIRLADAHAQQFVLGSISTPLEENASNFDGINTAPATRMGAIDSRMEPNPTNFDGVFDAAPFRTGTIGVTLDDATAVIRDAFLVYPIEPSGFLWANRSLITNQSATFVVTNTESLDGTWSDIGNGGSYRFEAGDLTGQAWIDFDVFDATGPGADLLGNRFTINVT